MNIFKIAYVNIRQKNLIRKFDLLWYNTIMLKDLPTPAGQVADLINDRTRYPYSERDSVTLRLATGLLLSRGEITPNEAMLFEFTRNSLQEMSVG